MCTSRCWNGRRELRRKEVGGGTLGIGVEAAQTPVCSGLDMGPAHTHLPTLPTQMCAQSWLLRPPRPVPAVAAAGTRPLPLRAGPYTLEGSRAGGAGPLGLETTLLPSLCSGRAP